MENDSHGRATLPLEWKYGAAGIGLLYAVSVTIVLEIPKN